MDFFKKVLKFIARLFVRQGLDKFLRDYIDLAIEILQALREVHSGEDFHRWRDEAFMAIKNQIELHERTIRDNWIAILMGLAWEVIKARTGA